MLAHTVYVVETYKGKNSVLYRMCSWSQNTVSIEGDFPLYFVYAFA